VKAIRQGYEDGQDLASLESELTGVPRELNDLFRHLLLSISPTQKKKAYQIFAMVLAFENHSTKLSSLACLYLDELDKDTDVIHGNITGCDAESSDTEDVKQLLRELEANFARAQKLLQGCCKGLVEVRKRGDSHPTELAGTQCILFVHRAAVEFLRQPDIMTTIDKHLSRNDIPEAITWLHLIEFVTMHPRLIDQSFWSESIANMILCDLVVVSMVFRFYR
jgi:hypothetical protein